VLLGRVGATTRIVSIGLQPLGALVAGVLLDAVAGAATLTTMGGLLLLASVLALLAPSLREARATPR
jgi:hypothetical protein